MANCTSAPSHLMWQRALFLHPSQPNCMAHPPYSYGMLTACWEPPDLPELGFLHWTLGAVIGSSFSLAPKTCQCCLHPWALCRVGERNAWKLILPLLLTCIELVYSCMPPILMASVDATVELAVAYGKAQNGHYCNDSPEACTAPSSLTPGPYSRHFDWSQWLQSLNLLIWNAEMSGKYQLQGTLTYTK